MEPWLGKEYKETILNDVEARADFIRRSRGMEAGRMKALVKTMVAEKVTSRRSRKRSKIISYVDIQDLRRHFKGKPEQYYKVKGAGPEFTCTHTGAPMYAIHTFKQDTPPSHLAMFN